MWEDICHCANTLHVQMTVCANEQTFCKKMLFMEDALFNIQLFFICYVYSFPKKDQIAIKLVKQNSVLIRFGIRKVPGTNAWSSWWLSLGTGLIWKPCLAPTISQSLHMLTLIRNIAALSQWDALSDFQISIFRVIIHWSPILLLSGENLFKTQEFIM